MVPELVANPEFVAKVDRTRQLKKISEETEKELKDLQVELGGMIAVANQKSVAYLDMIVVNVDGALVKGKLTGAALVEQATRQQFELHGDPELPQHILYAVAMAAKDCDPNVLVENGFPPMLIEPARDPATRRAGSTQIKWVGGSGKGGRKRAEGSGGPVQ
jgi:hypothetical protein